MNRRSFLRGLIAAAVAPAIIRTPGLLMPIKPRLGLKPFDFFVGTSDDLAFLEGLSQTIAQTIYYADDRPPRQFQGFTPFYTRIPIEHVLTDSIFEGLVT